MEKVGVGISGMGFYFPEKKISTIDIAKAMDMPEKVYLNTGIVSSYEPNINEQPSYMAYNAAVAAMSDSSLMPDDIDLIVVPVFRNDYLHWQMSVWLRNKLKAIYANVLEIKGGCGAFAQAVRFSYDQIAGSSEINDVLIVCSERLFHYGWPTFLSSGGQAIVLSRNCKQFSLLGFGLDNQVKYHDFAYIPIGGTASPFSKDRKWSGKDFSDNVVVDKDKYYNNIKPNFFERFAIITYNMLNEIQVDIQDVNYMISIIQQKNFDERILSALNMPNIKTASEFKPKLGNFSGADPYILLDLARRNGKIKKGDLILLYTIGGVSWFVELIKY